MPGRLDERLLRAGCVFAGGSALHLVDHLRRGQTSVTDELYWAGNAALVVQVAIITLVLARHRAAPVAAALGGIPLAVGFLSAHWLPTWSALSDPVWEIRDLTWLSYLASTSEIVGALAVGTVGLAVMRDRARRSPRTAQA